MTVPCIWVSFTLVCLCVVPDDYMCNIIWQANSMLTVIESVVPVLLPKHRTRVGFIECLGTEAAGAESTAISCGYMT